MVLKWQQHPEAVSTQMNLGYVWIALQLCYGLECSQQNFQH